ncbi:Blue copper protein [Linum grandiflorum]
MADRNSLSINLLAASFILTLVVSSCGATTYTVGDNSGWDISSDLDSWAQDKTFNVGDALLFQYTSSETVEEVNKASFDGCTTTDVIKSYNDGNTTVALDRAGAWYFVCGNKLYCLGGMKLQVDVKGNQSAASSPVGSPEGQPANPSSKTDFPSSSAFVHASRETLVMVVLSFASIFWVVVHL